MKKDNLTIVKQKVLSGMVILILRDFGLKIISIIGQIVLIRLVAPEYFGIFAIITFITNFAELFSDFGFSQAIVQEKNKLSKIQLSTIFYVKLFITVIIFLLLIVAFPLIKSFYHQLPSEAFIMTIILASTMFLKTIKRISVALFDKELQFDTISKIEVIGMIVYFLVAIFLAYQHIYLWNFVFAIVAKELVEFLLTFYYKPWLPSLSFNLSSIKKIVRFGAFLQLGSIIALVQTSIIPIAGFRLSSSHLGLLDWSFNISNLSSAVFENYGRVAFAGMARIQHDLNRISSSVNKSISILNSFAFLFILLILGYSGEFTFLILSQKWLPALPSLYWFVLGLLFFGGSITIAHALLALGKSKEVTLFTGLIVAIEVILGLTLIQQVGFVGIAITVFISNCIQLVGYVFLAKMSHMRLEFKKPFFEKIIVLVISWMFVLLLNNFIQEYFLITLIGKISISIIVYLIFLRVFSKQDVDEFFKIMRLLKN